MARFERSTLPEHKDTRTVVIRFLKIITPLTCVIPNYDEHTGIPRPVEEGGLHQRAFRFANRVWNINIDIPHPKAVCQPDTIRGFQLLGMHSLFDAVATNATFIEGMYYSLNENVFHVFLCS